MCHDYLVKQNVFIKETVGMDDFRRKCSVVHHKNTLCTTENPYLSQRSINVSSFHQLHQIALNTTAQMSTTQIH